MEQNQENYFMHISRAVDTASSDTRTGRLLDEKLSDSTAHIVKKKEIVTRRVGHSFSW